MYDILEELGPTLAQLDWQGTKSWNTGAIAGTWGGSIIVTDVAISPNETKYVETGHFTLNGDDYLFVVNRRTLSTESRNIILTLNNAITRQVTDVLTGISQIVFANGNFSALFGPGEGRLFKVGPVPLPAAPTLASPANNVTNVVTAPTLTWNTLSGATSYQAQVSKTNSFGAGDILFDQSNLTTTSFVVPGLVTNTTFYWRVRGRNAGGDGPWSEIRSLRTKSVVDVNTIWSGQITLTSSSWVYSPATLTIEAGTTLTMYPNVLLNVYGNLNVQGTSAQNVIFDGINPVNWYWPWALLNFQGGASGTIRYAEFRNSKFAITFRDNPGNLTVTNCIFNGYGSNSYGSSADGAAIEISANPEEPPLNIGTINISDNTFTSNQYGYGLYVWNVRSTSLSLNNNTFSNLYTCIYSRSGGSGNIGGGQINLSNYGYYANSLSPTINGVAFNAVQNPIYLQGAGSITVENCLINVKPWTQGIYSEGSIPTIKNNSITWDGQSSQYWRDAIFIYSGRATIEANQIANIDRAVYIAPYTTSYSESYVRGNTITDVSEGILAYDAPFNMVIKDNVIQQIRPNGWAIKSNGTESIQYNKLIGNEVSPVGYGIFTANTLYGPSSIFKNELSGFYSAFYFYYGQLPTTAGVFSQNNFKNNTWNMTNYVQTTVNVAENWWGVCYPYPVASKFQAGMFTYSPPLYSPALGTGPGGTNNSWPSCQILGESFPSEDRQKKVALTVLPTEFALQQNHPNPFNPSTVIRYDIPERSNVVIRIFDLVGREVCTLVSGEKDAGYYSLEWDGTGSSGESIASGFYFCRLVAFGQEQSARQGPFVRVLKMVLSR